MGDLTKNFDRSEFRCSCGCGAEDISLRLVGLLQEVRDEVGPMTITSGVRCEDHNREIGGVADSAHVPGLAADILCVGSRDRYRLVLSLLQRFSRVGMGKTFIHVDIDPRKPKDVFWTYYVADHQA